MRSNLSSQRFDTLDHKRGLKLGRQKGNAMAHNTPNRVFRIDLSEKHHNMILRNTEQKKDDLTQSKSPELNIIRVFFLISKVGKTKKQKYEKSSFPC